MDQDIIVYFVSFETPLDKVPFMMQWENYTSTTGNQKNVALQQTGIDGKYTYISQHMGKAGEFQFLVTKAARSHGHTTPEVRVKQMGGYSIMQKGKKHLRNIKHNKLFIFITKPQADLSIYKDLPVSTLNIYQGYYENCSFAYILELFVEPRKLAALVTQLKLQGEEATDVYTECKLSLVAV